MRLEPVKRNLLWDPLGVGELSSQEIGGRVVVVACSLQVSLSKRNDAAGLGELRDRQELKLNANRDEMSC